MAVTIGCAMTLTLWNFAPVIVSRMGASADVAKCVQTAAMALKGENGQNVPSVLPSPCSVFRSA